MIVAVGVYVVVPGVDQTVALPPCRLYTSDNHAGTEPFDLRNVNAAPTGVHCGALPEDVKIPPAAPIASLFFAVALV
jgi:hypothetical protein